MASQRGNTLKLGQIVGTNRELVLPPDGRDKHLYVCGATGTGKSKFLENLIRQDIRGWYESRCGLILLDPHGSLYDAIMEWLGWERPERLPIIPIDLRRDSWTVAYNALRRRTQAEPSVIVDSFVDAMAHVWGAESTDATPRFERWATNILRTLYDNGHTLLEAEFLIDHFGRNARSAMAESLSDRMMKQDWELLGTLRPQQQEEQFGSTANRLQRFIRNPHMRAIFGQNDISLDLRRALDEGYIILVSLATAGARVSEENADLFATLLLTDLWKAAQERGKKPGVKPFYVYLDEFQRFVTPTIAAGLDEARGFGLHLTMANQYPQQLLDRGASGQRLYHSVMENASSKVVFRLQSRENLQPLAEWLFMGTLDPEQIKLQLESTKVIGYSEELRTSESSASCSGRMSGSGHTAAADSWLPMTRSSQRTSSRSDSYGAATSSVLIPIFGKEISSVQFRSLEEQLHLAMQSLFDQQQRYCCARLVGMSSATSLVTPTVKPVRLRPQRVQAFEEKMLRRWDFALPVAEAHARLKTRRTELEAVFRQSLVAQEPATARRQLPTPVPTPPVLAAPAEPSSNRRRRK